MLYETGAAGDPGAFTYDPADIFDPVGFQKMAAELEAAGCMEAPDVFACYRDALDAGLVGDLTLPGGHMQNMVDACKAGARVACTQVLRAGLAGDLGCLALEIEAWAPNIECDCSAESEGVMPTGECWEREELTGAERTALQRGRLEWTASAGTGGMGGRWLMAGGIAGAAALLWFVVRGR